MITFYQRVLRFNEAAAMKLRKCAHANGLYAVVWRFNEAAAMKLRKSARAIEVLSTGAQSFNEAAAMKLRKLGN